MFINNFCLNMFRASLCPYSGAQRPCYSIWCVVLVLLDVVGSGCGALSCRMWSLWRFLFTFTYTSPQIRKITDLFKHTNVRIAYKCTNTILHLFKPTNKALLPSSPYDIFKELNRNLHSDHILQDSAPQPLPTTSSRTRTTHQMQ